MEERFTADRNLGKLAKWLRILGYDTLYDRENADRNFLRRVAAGGRIALTRKQGLARLSQQPGRLVVVKADRVEKQIGEVTTALNLTPDPGKRLTRCLRCNEPLGEVDREAVEGLVPAYVFEKYDRFLRCPSCLGIFWPGTHHQRVEEELRSRSPAHHP